ncbi:unnamed protein product [Calypogeia fissa]
MAGGDAEQNERSEYNGVDREEEDWRTIKVRNGSGGMGGKNGEGAAGDGGGNSVLAEVKMQFQLAWPIVAANVLSYSVVCISVMFVGHLGEVELSSVSLANSFAVVSGFSLMMGLGTGLETLCGQAYGAKRYHLLGVYLQSAFIVTNSTLIPILLIWFNMEKILLAVGQDPQISKNAAYYLRHMAPALFSSAFSQPLIKFLQTQSIVMPMMLCSLVSALLHPFVCYTYIYLLDFGFVGGALATTTSYMFLFILLLSYTIFSGKCGQCWGGFAIRDAFGSVKLYLNLAVPSVVMICFEWWSFELLVLSSGLLPKPSLELSLLTVSLNTVNLTDMIPLGLCVAASIRVSNELGANRPDKAKLASKVVLCLAVFDGCIVFVALMLSRHFWGHAFTNVEEVLDYVAEVTPFLACLTFMDAVQYVGSGVIRGCGRQALGAGINLTAYYIIGIPTCLLFAFWLRLNGKGLVMGLVFAIFVQTTFVLSVVSCTNWRRMADTALDRIARGAHAASLNAPLLPSHSKRPQERLS